MVSIYLYDTIKVGGHFLFTLLAHALHSFSSKCGHWRDSKSIQEKPKN